MILLGGQEMECSWSMCVLRSSSPDVGSRHAGCTWEFGGVEFAFYCMQVRLSV